MSAVGSARPRALYEPWRQTWPLPAASGTAPIHEPHAAYTHVPSGLRHRSFGAGTTASTTVVRVRNQKTLPFWEVETVEKALMRKAL